MPGFRDQNPNGATTAEYIAGLRLLDNNDRRDWIGLGSAIEGTSTLAIPFGQKSALYRAAVSLLGKHLTLNKNVDPELGCAEAVSYVIHQAYPAANIPKSGYPGTAGLYDWLRGSRLFKELRACVLKAPDGTIIISTTPKGGGTHGHVGIFTNGYSNPGFTIASNDSGTLPGHEPDTGKFTEHDTIGTWQQRHGVLGVHLFVPIDSQ